MEMPQAEDSKSEQQNKGKSPAFQFYPKDWLTDIHIKMMSNAESGLYFTILCHDWLENGLTEQELNDLIERGINGGSRLVRERFNEHPEREGYFTNPRLQKERERQAEWRKKSAKAGKASAKARKAQGLASQPAANQSSTNGQPKGNSSSPTSSSSSSTSSNNNKKRTLSSADFVFPEKLNRIECKSAVDGWIKHRTELKKPITKSAIEQLLKKYAERPSDLVRDIKHSVMNGWQGLFAPKVDPPKVYNNQNGSQHITRPPPKPNKLPWEKKTFVPETRPLEELKKIKEA